MKLLTILYQMIIGGKLGSSAVFMQLYKGYSMTCPCPKKQYYNNS